MKVNALGCHRSSAHIMPTTTVSVKYKIDIKSYTEQQRAGQTALLPSSPECIATEVSKCTGCNVTKWVFATLVEI